MGREQSITLRPETDMTPPGQQLTLQSSVKVGDRRAGSDHLTLEV